MHMRFNVTLAVLSPSMDYLWIMHMRRFTSTVPARDARAPNRAISITHVYDTRKYFKKLFDKRLRRIFSSAFQ